MTFARIFAGLTAATLAAPALAATEEQLREALVGNTYQGGMGGVRTAVQNSATVAAG